MKTVAFVGAVVLLVAGLAAPAAQAQQCLKWVAFCGGIQIDSIDAVSGRIDAQWYHYDCANNVDMTLGVIRPVPNACPGGPGDAGIACLASDTCGQLLGGSDWTLIIDAPLDGTLDMTSAGRSRAGSTSSSATTFWAPASAHRSRARA